MKKILALVLAGLAALSGWSADIYSINGGSADITSTVSGTGRFIIWQGTVNIKEGGTVRCGGNTHNTCNFVGIDKSNATAILNIAGGTFWADSSLGSGYLAVGSNNYNIKSTVNLNSGTLKVDGVLRMATQWNGNGAATSSGTVNINGGTATIANLQLGAEGDSSGTGTVNLNGGVLQTPCISFLKYGTQTFTFGGGTLQATGAYAFQPYKFLSTSKTRTVTVKAGTTSTFQTGGYNQTLLQMTGTGTLAFTGGGALTFLEDNLSYALAFTSGTYKLPTALTMKSLTLSGDAKLVFSSLPESASVTYLTTTDGITLPTGKTITDCVTVPQGTAALSADGKSIVVTMAAATVASAYWTGAGAKGVATDPANWSCFNAAGEAVADVLPSTGTRVYLTGSSANLPVADIQGFGAQFVFGDARIHQQPTFGRIDYGSRGDYRGLGYLSQANVEYWYYGASSLNNLRATGTSWLSSYLATAQVKFSGWFYVPADEAGTWTFYQYFDDYFGFAIDGQWVSANQSYQAALTTTHAVTAGWHRFTLVAGDTYGGYGSSATTSDGLGTRPMLVTTPKKTSQPFESHIFTFGEDTAPVFTLTEDLDLRGCTIDAFEGAVIDLNGHTLDIDSLFIGDLAQSSVTVTDTRDRDPGVLRIHVAEGQTLTNKVIHFAGKASCEKLGAGTLVLSIGSQSNTGTFDIREGTVIATGDNCFCAYGNKVFIRKGATWDINGGSDLYRNYYVLDGGTVTNSGANVSNGWSQFGHFILTADSTVSGNVIQFVYASWAACSWQFNGHTLNVAMNEGKRFRLGNVSDAAPGGTVRVMSGTFSVLNKVDTLSHTDLVLEPGTAFSTGGDEFVSNANLGNGNTGNDTGNYMYLHSVTATDAFLAGNWWCYLYGDLTLDGTSATITNKTPLQVTGRLVKKGTGTVTFLPNSNVCNFFLGGIDIQEGGLVMLRANCLDNGKYSDLHIASGASLDAMNLRVKNFTVDAGATFTTKNMTHLEMTGTLTGLASFATNLTLYAGAKIVLPAGATSFTVGGVLARSGAATLDVSALFADGEPTENEVTVLTAKSITGTAAFNVTGLTTGWAAEVGSNAVVIRKATTAAELPHVTLSAAPAANGLNSYTFAFPSVAAGNYTLVDWPTNATLAAYGTPTVTFPADFNLEWEILPFATNVVLHVKSAEESARTPIKVWCVGDDFLEASSATTNPNARIPLAQFLTLAGWNVQMTGCRTTYGTCASGATVRDAWKGHTCISGIHYKTASGNVIGLLQGLETYAWAAQRPDFTILSSGIHDYYGGLAAADIFAGWTNTCFRILNALPGTTLIVSTVTDAKHSDATRQANRVTLNGLIRDYCALSAENGGFPEGRVHLVDIDAIFNADTPSLYSDNYRTTWLGADAVAEAFAAKLMTLATGDGKADTTNVYPALTTTHGATANVPAAYTTGFTHVRTLEPTTSSYYAQNADAVPYTYAPAVAQTDIAKAGYYIELVRKDSGEMKAMWIDMDAPGSTLSDILLPVTHGLRKQKSVSKLHVWSTYGGVSQVAATDDTVAGYIEWNPVNYGGAAKNANGAAAETWSSQFDWNDTLTESGTSGYGCFQFFRKAPPDGYPAECLFAFNNWGSAHDGTYTAMGFGTFANVSLFGSQSMDWTFITGNSGDVLNLNSAAYSLCRIEFWAKYASGDGSIDLATLADGIWSGAASTDFGTAGNWTNKTGTALTTLASMDLYLPPHAGDATAFSYIGYNAYSYTSSHLYVDGAYALPSVGAFIFNDVTFGANGRLVYDPAKVTLRTVAAPNFRAGFKFALDAKYAAHTKGRFLLLEWDAGEIDSSLDLTSFFDATTAQGANVKVWAETVGTGGRLWLDLDASEGALTQIRVMPVGDSITHGSNSTYGNWRIPLMKKLLAAGYEPTSTGFRNDESTDETGLTMPEQWKWHSGVGGRRLISNDNGGGVAESLGAELDQAHDVDALLIKIGTNDINSDNVSVAKLFATWQDMITHALTMTSAKIFCGAVVDIAYDSVKNAKVVAFNAAMKKAIETDKIFGEGRVYFVDLYTPCYRYDADGKYITGSFYDATNLHPDWPGEDKMADAWCAAIQTALPGAMPDHTAEHTTTTGATANVPAAYITGFKRARVLDVIAAKAKGVMTRDGVVPYEDYSAEGGATANLSRVGYYVEMKRKNTAITDYGETVRWLWVDMDAFGARDIESCGVPLFSSKDTQGAVTRLHTIGNMPGVTTVAADDDTQKGFVEFWPYTYTDTACTKDGAPTHLRGYDWSDTYTPAGQYGSMQVHLLTPTRRNAAEVLFAFNRFTSNANFEMGLGNLSLHDKNSIDRTFLSESVVAGTMGLGAYEVAKIEIWTKSVAEDATALAGPLTTVSEVAFVDGTATVTGSLESHGTTGASSTVTIEWSTDPTFGTVTGSAAVGAFTGTCPAALSATVTGLDDTQAWYFRFRAVNDQDIASTTATPGVYEKSSATWRATTASDTWASAAWLKTGADANTTFVDGWKAIFDSNETAQPAQIQLMSDVKTSGIEVKGANDYTFIGDGTTAVTAPSLVKEGAGTLTLDALKLTGVSDGITVKGGTLRLGDNAIQGVLGELGTKVTVEDGAQLDLNYNATSGGDTTRSALTHGAILDIAGAGPDGSGALVNNSGLYNWGYLLGRLTLSDDATIGGSGRIDLRPNTGFAYNASRTTLAGEGKTLTIKLDTPGDTGDGFNMHTADVNLKKIIVDENADMGIEGSSNFTVPEGVEMKNGSRIAYYATASGQKPSIKVTGATAKFQALGGNSTQNAPVEVSEDSTLSLTDTYALTFTSPVTNNGEIVASGAHAIFRSSIEGAGTFRTGSTSQGLRFSGSVNATNLWLNYANDVGGTLYLGESGVSGLPKFAGVHANVTKAFTLCMDVPTSNTLTGNYDELFTGSPLNSVYVYSYNSTATQTFENVNWTVDSFNGGNASVESHIKFGTNANVTVKGYLMLGNAASPKATSLEIGQGAKVTITGSEWNRMRIGHWTGNTGLKHEVVVDGGTLTQPNGPLSIIHHAPYGYFHLYDGLVSAKGLYIRAETGSRQEERFEQFGGRLEVGANSIWTAARKLNTVHADLANGTLKALDNFTVRPYTHIVFGNDLTAAPRTYTIDTNGKTITWNRPVTGSSDVTLTGTGMFSSSSDYQGIAFGHWTVATTGSSYQNLSGISSFAKGLTLTNSASAYINVNGENQIESIYYSGSGSFANACTYATNLANVTTTTLTHMKKFSQTLSNPDPNNSSWIFRGEFFVDEDHANQTWYFAGTFDDLLCLTIDGTAVFTTTGCTNIGQGSRTLTGGWHTFTITCYDGTGSQGPTQGSWKNSKSVGWAMTNGGTDATKYAAFDTSTLKMRRTQASAKRAWANWKRWAGSGYAGSNWDTADMSATAPTVLTSVKVLHENGTSNVKSALNELTGSFYVDTTEVGSWLFRGQFDDRISLTIDGTKILATQAYNAYKEGSCTLTEGWHTYRLRFADGTGGAGAMMTDGDNISCSLMAKTPSAPAKFRVFDERNFQFALTPFQAQSSSRSGLGGTTMVGAGSTLFEGSGLSGYTGYYCPIWGVLAGTGTLEGPFRFTSSGTLACEGTPNKQQLALCTFKSADAKTFADLAKIDVTFPSEPRRTLYTVADAMGLTDAKAAEIAVTVKDAEGKDYSEDFTARVQNGKLVLRNEGAKSLTIFIR